VTSNSNIIREGVGADLAVALVRPKFPHNVGAAVRAASCFNVPQVWFTGDRFEFDKSRKGARLPREERMKGYNKVEICHGDYFFDAFAAGVTPVAVDLVPGTENLITFEHPENALYVFGPEDGSLSSVELRHCHRFVSIPMAHCANLSSAVYMVLYDRHAKRVREGLEDPISLDETRGSQGWEEPDTMMLEVALP